MTLHSQYQPSGFFVVRAPLLAWEELAALIGPGPGDALPGSPGSVPVDACARATRQRLRELLERPDIREALYLASPSLVHALEASRAAVGDTAASHKAERAALRYVVRMAWRPTPFGAFAAVSLGQLGSATRLELPARGAIARYSRIALPLLARIYAHLRSQPDVVWSSPCTLNPTVYQACGQWRYMRVVEQPGPTRARLVALPVTPVTERVVLVAGGVVGGAACGAASRHERQPEELVAALLAAPELMLSPQAARAVVEHLLATELLLPALYPPTTGALPMDDLRARVAAAGPSWQPMAQALDRICAELRGLDQTGLGAPLAAYQRLHACLADLGAQPAQDSDSAGVHVDLVRTAPGLSLDRRVADTLLRGVDALRRLCADEASEPPDALVDAFVDRYGDREVPLAHVLDDSVGLVPDSMRLPPLVAEIAGRARAGPSQAQAAAHPILPAHALLLAKLEAAWRRGQHEIVLDPRELAPLPAAPLPDAFEVCATLDADSPQSLDRGCYRALVAGVCGPSGVRALGRFASLDADIRHAVEEHLRAEEALAGEDAVFAEIVHMPALHAGNALHRPCMRAYELPWLGRSGAPVERQLTLADLLVSVRDRALVLRSQRLGKRIIPRLGNAHNIYFASNLRHYRFLCALMQYRALSFSWGALGTARFLPRVRVGNIVLSLRQWRLDAEELRSFARATLAERFLAVQEWRDRHEVGRYVDVIEHGSPMLVDLDSPYLVDSLVAHAARLPSVSVRECFPQPGQGLIRSPEGICRGEIRLCFVRRPDLAIQPLPPIAPPPARSAVWPGASSHPPRTYHPGDEWLYLQLHAREHVLDRLLADALGPAVRALVAEGVVQQWFFVRFWDPTCQLRLRLHGPIPGVLAAAAPALRAALAPALHSGLVHRLSITTYEREVERYGGAHAIALAEHIFHHDSEAALRIISELQGHGHEHERWLLALLSVDRLLTDAALSGALSCALAGQQRQRFRAELALANAHRRALDTQFRRQRAQLEALLWAPDAHGWQAQARTALAERSRHLAPAIQALWQLERAGELTRPLIEIIPSLAHMAVNRLIPAEPRTHELLVWDALHRLYTSRRARLAQAAPGRAPRAHTREGEP